MPNLGEVAKDLPPTTPVYWEDSYKKNLQSRILRIVPDEKKHYYIVLDRTIFYPKGGGQPSDRGTIDGAHFKFQVKKVMQTGQVVVHWGKMIEGELDKDSEVTGALDWEWRFLMMRRHSAAHLLDHCLATTLGKEFEASDSWLGEPSVYVAYHGETPSTLQLQAVEKLENQLIAEKRKIRTELVTVAQAKQKLPGRTSLLGSLPSNLKELRLVTVDGCQSIPCGGTHLGNVGEAKEVRIDRAESQAQDEFRVYFDIARDVIV